MSADQKTAWGAFFPSNGRRTKEPGAQDEPQRNQRLTMAIRERTGTLPIKYDFMESAKSAQAEAKDAQCYVRSATTLNEPQGCF